MAKPRRLLLVALAEQRLEELQHIELGCSEVEVEPALAEEEVGLFVCSEARDLRSSQYS